jgi:hypothetical protein
MEWARKESGRLCHGTVEDITSKGACSEHDPYKGKASSKPESSALAAIL